MSLLAWAVVNTLEDDHQQVVASTAVAQNARLLDELFTQAKSAQVSYVTDVHAYGAIATGDGMARRSAYVQLMNRIDETLAQFPTEGMSEQERKRFARIQDGAKKFAAFDDESRGGLPFGRRRRVERG